MVLGVTGGIATGKSSVAAMLGECGAVVVSADDLARQAVAPGSDALAALVERFGRGILFADGALDRERLARLVFADPVARAELNRITHPAIARLAEERLAQLRAAGHPLIVYEAPLLFEAGAESRVDQVLVVCTAPDIQQQRLMQRDTLSAEDAQTRIATQMPLTEKIRRADYLIDNSGTLAEARLQVAELCKELLHINSHGTPP